MPDDSDDPFGDDFTSDKNNGRRTTRRLCRLTKGITGPVLSHWMTEDINSRTTRMVSPFYHFLRLKLPFWLHGKLRSNKGKHNDISIRRLRLLDIQNKYVYWHSAYFCKYRVILKFSVSLCFFSLSLLVANPTPRCPSLLLPRRSLSTFYISLLTRRYMVIHSLVRSCFPSQSQSLTFLLDLPCTTSSRRYSTIARAFYMLTDLSATAMPFERMCASAHLLGKLLKNWCVRRNSVIAAIPSFSTKARQAWLPSPPTVTSHVYSVLLHFHWDRWSRGYGFGECS